MGNITYKQSHYYVIETVVCNICFIQTLSLRQRYLICVEKMQLVLKNNGILHVLTYIGNSFSNGKHENSVNTPWVLVLIC